MNRDEEVGSRAGMNLISNREDETTDLLPMVNLVDGQYGSTSSSSSSGDNEDDNFDDEEDMGESSFQSNKRGRNPIGSSNLMVSARKLATSSFLNKTPSGGEYDTVPTLVEEDRVVLVCDTNLDWYSLGGFYYAEDAFYNPKVEPQYAITVGPSIYQKLIQEVYLSSNVPCGMYFCCQGGDGAHTGEAHKDFVDIQLAWTIMGIVFLCMIIISIFDVDDVVSFS